MVISLFSVCSVHSGTSSHWLSLLSATHAASLSAMLRVTNRCKVRLSAFFLYGYFFIFSLFSAFWYFFALALFAVSDPRGITFSDAARDQSLQSSPKRLLSIWLFLYFQFVQCILVLLRIGVVLAKGLGEVVCSREILLCAHVQIVMLLVV